VESCSRNLQISSFFVNTTEPGVLGLSLFVKDRRWSPMLLRWDGCLCSLDLPLFGAVFGLGLLCLCRRGIREESALEIPTSLLVTVLGLVLLSPLCPWGFCVILACEIFSSLMEKWTRCLPLARFIGGVGMRWAALSLQFVVDFAFELGFLKDEVIRTRLFLDLDPALEKTVAVVSIVRWLAFFAW